MRNALASGLALGAAVLVGQSAAAQLPEKKALSLEAARKMVAAAEAERDRWRGVVAVVDDGGWVILVGAHGPYGARVDGADRPSYAVVRQRR